MIKCLFSYAILFQLPPHFGQLGLVCIFVFFLNPHSLQQYPWSPSIPSRSGTPCPPVTSANNDAVSSSSKYPVIFHPTFRLINVRHMNNSNFSEAYRLFYAPLYAYAFYLTGNRADSEDLVSETFIRAFLSWNETGSLRAWMFQVLKHLFIDEARKRKHIAEVTEDYLLNMPVPMIRDDLEEERLWLLEEIRKMKYMDQEIMILSLYSGMSDTDIASHLSISVENLRVRRHRIKQRLKEAAERRNTNE